jgi:hypothetical protein
VLPLVYHNPKIGKCTSHKKELWEKQKLPSKPTPWDAIAFTQLFDGLITHMPNFMVDPNGKIYIE